MHKTPATTTAVGPSGQAIANQNCQRGAHTGQQGRNRIRPKPAGDLRLRQFVPPIECRHGLVKPDTRRVDVALIGGADQRRDLRAGFRPRLAGVQDRAGRSALSRVWRRAVPMARGGFRHRAKVHGGLGQSAQWLVEDPRLGALEISELCMASIWR